MTFAVDGRAEALRVIARWGQYERADSQHAVSPKTGEPKRVWKRRQIEGVIEPVALREDSLGPWPAAAEFPDVVVKGKARRLEDEWIVTLFLVNEQEESKTDRDRTWLFQPELVVESPDGAPIFKKRLRHPSRRRVDAEEYAEEELMAMVYRRHVEFAVGHGVAVHAETAKGDPTRAVRIATRVVPAYEVPKVDASTPEDNPDLAGLVLDMKELAEATDGQLATKLAVLPTAYAAWIERERRKIAEPNEGLAEFRQSAEEALERCERALGRIRNGIGLLARDGKAAEAFRFANRAMWLQRSHSISAQEIRRGRRVSLAEVENDPENRRWYPFQIAFILLNLSSLTDLHHPDRCHETDAVADLLWFPTGGGKTEAYLGLAAYAMGLRRLQGKVGGRSGEAGVAVLMRYTLRLLTIQQFQRAAALLCACEVIRRGAPKTWGNEPFRLGLWVGYRTTPNKTEHSAEAVRALRGQGRPGGSGSPHQITYCPWCGTEIDPGRDIQVKGTASDCGRTLIYCGDTKGECPFSAKQSPDEGIPILVVDEEIYRRLPAMLIATVDKFAQMPWKGMVQMLFGQVNGYCPRHGFRSPELEDSDTHHETKSGLPAVKTETRGPLRPPDLIIQDELHLISGPLGSLVGLYETVVDDLCSWEVDGRRVRPKVVASTATIRRARDQVHGIFLRRCETFPPNGTDVRDNFFALQREPDEAHPGRRYLGICAPGKRLKAALIRTYVAFFAAAQKLYEQYGAAADPWMTLVGYFNSLRELGGMRRLVEDDIRSRLGQMDQRGLAKRWDLLLQELTSRADSTDIPRILDQLEVRFDPADEQRRKEARRQWRKTEIPEPIDVLLATNMVSVGVDVRRLGLMLVAGQPKTTVEYIQATSRIGRSKPGIVCTIYNWARPRDLSHYETFEHYHATFYKHVEALSVTPFAPRALDRGLAALLVALVRLAGMDFNENKKAGELERRHALVSRALEAIAARGERVTGETQVRRDTHQAMEYLLDLWLAEAGRKETGRILGYEDEPDGKTKGLLRRAGEGKWEPFTCLNSLRDVEPAVSLLLNDEGMDVLPELSGSDTGGPR